MEAEVVVLGTGPGTDIRGVQMIGTMTRESAVTGRSTWVQDWAQYGSCRTAEPDALFVRGAAQQIAKQVCMGCPVIAECLADSLDNQTEFGIWGGMTERERRALLKRRPHVASWRAVFEADRARQECPAS